VSDNEQSESGELPNGLVFESSGVSDLPNLQNFVSSKLSCCPVQFSPVLQMRKISYLLNRSADEPV
jgi:hypothetical protein